jgi:hypothetical protein
MSHAPFPLSENNLTFGLKCQSKGRLSHAYTNDCFPQFIEGKISEHLESLEAWARVTLSEDINPTFGHHSPVNRDQFLLRIEYWSTKILITRPCVCRIEQRISDESKSSTRFNIQAARTCVDAALEMVKSFPNDPDLNFIYSTGPWWAITHLSEFPFPLNISVNTSLTSMSSRAINGRAST